MDLNKIFSKLKFKLEKMNGDDDGIKTAGAFQNQKNVVNCVTIIVVIIVRVIFFDVILLLLSLIES